TRCVALTVHANLAGVQGARAATLVWVEKDHIGPARYACLPKEPTSGIRGADISGIRFDGAELGETAVIGARGAGLEITLCSLQVTRTLCCGLSIGAGDTAVRTIFGFMQGRRLYGAALHEHAQARHLLARTFALQLVAESVAL